MNNFTHANKSGNQFLSHAVRDGELSVMEERVGGGGGGEEIRLESYTHQFLRK